MGKMKELHIAMQEAKWEGTSNEFLTWWINNEAKEIRKKEALTGLNTSKGTKIVTYKKKLNENNNNTSSNMDNNRTTSKIKKK